jgi:hypothetical protein
MNNVVNNNSNRPKMKKVKRPVKKPIMGSSNISVPSKVDENPFAQQNNSGKSMDAFNLDSYLDADNLPTIQKQEQSPLNNNFERSFIRDEDISQASATWKDRLMVGELFTGRAILITAGLFLIFGMIFSKFFLEAPKSVQHGLQGVVVNSEVPRGRARCGVAEKTQGCVLYIMNPQRQDLNGRDFYDLAAQLTGRQRFMIETGNMRYSNTKIRPGEIAQLNIPPLQ